MLILALDTSSTSGSIALVRDGCLISESNSPDVGTHSEWLMPSIEAMMAASGIAASGIDVVAVSMGPGSFTGLRIGVSIAKGIAWTLGCPIIGVSTLKALALNLRDTGYVAVPLLDARRSQVYSAVYSFPGGETTPVFEESALGIEALLDEISARGLASQVLFTGAGLKVYSDRLLESVSPEQIAGPELWCVKASTVAELAYKELLGGAKGLKPVDFSPFYLRKSEAEVRLKLNRTKPST